MAHSKLDTTKSSIRQQIKDRFAEEKNSNAGEKTNKPMRSSNSRLYAFQRPSGDFVGPMPEKD